MLGMDGFARHMRRRGLAASTIERRSSALRTFALWLEPRELLDATGEDIELFLDQRLVAGRPIDMRTRYWWISLLHVFYQWALNEGLGEDDPTETIVRPKMRKLLPRPIGEDDLAMAMEAADRQMGAWLALGAYAGLRAGEVARLAARDVSEQDGVIRVFGKGSKERMVPIHPTVTDRLRAWGIPKRGPIFTRPRGGQWPAKALSTEVGLYFVGLGIDAVFHMCRHRFATQTLRACGNLRTVQELLGHADIGSTALYTAFMLDNATAAVLALPTFQAALATAQ